MTADELALIAAVVAAPDDDTPRLVYADYLDERGDADRAEFIRAQCDHARRLANSEAVPPELVQKVDALRPVVSAKDDWLVMSGGYVPYRRGFVESVRVAGASGAAVTLALLHCSPLRELLFEFTETDPTVPRDGSDIQVFGRRGKDVRRVRRQQPGEMQSENLLKRLESPDNPPFYTPDPRATAGVTQMTVYCSPDCPADRVVELLARQCGVVRPQLVLNLSRCPLHEDGARWLFESASFDRLTAVWLDPRRCFVPATLAKRLRAKFGDRLIF